MGYCLYGNDINDHTSPISAGLSWVTKFNKEFIGKILFRTQTSRNSKKLIAFELLERGIPRKDYEITNADGKLIGKVTSGTMGPSVRKAIGMGYVNSNFSNFGNGIFINIRNKSIPAKIVKLPFFKIE